MRNKWIYIGFSMLLALFIYSFFRSENTIINQLWLSLFPDNYLYLRGVFGQYDVPDFVRFNLPGVLWMIGALLLCAKYTITIRKLRFKLMFLPLLVCVIIEVVQWVGITDGTFDMMDVVSYLLGFVVVYAMYTSRTEKKECILRMQLAHIPIVILFFFSIYLSDMV